MVDGKLRYYLMAYTWIWIPAVLVGLFSRLWQLGVDTAIVLWVASLFVKRKEQGLTIFEQDVFADMEAKLNQPLFQTEIRLGVYSPTRAAL